MAAFSKEHLIENFLREELTPEELIEFRERWENDPEFVKEVKEYANLTVSLKAAQRLGQDRSARKKGVVVRLRKAFYQYQSVAAIVLLAIMLPLYLLLQGQKRAITAESPEVKELALKYFAQDRLTYLTKEEKLPNQVKEAVADGDPQRAIHLLKQSHEWMDQFSFVLGDLYVTTKQADSALLYYRLGLMNHPDDATGQWNSAMALLYSGDLIEVKKQLNLMAQDSGHAYQSKANEVLSHLD